MYRLLYIDRASRPKLDCCICYRANVPAHLLLLHSSCRYVMSSVVPPYLLLHALASSSFYPDHYDLMRSFHTASQNSVIIVPLDLAVRIAIGPTKNVLLPVRSSLAGVERRRSNGTARFNDRAGADRAAGHEGGASDPSSRGFVRPHAVGGEGTTDFTRRLTNTSGGRPHVLASIVETARLEKQPLAIGAVLRQLWQYGGNSGEVQDRQFAGQSGLPWPYGAESSRYAQYAPALRPLVRSIGSSIIMEGCATFGRVDFLTAAITQFAHFHSLGLHG